MDGTHQQAVIVLSSVQKNMCELRWKQGFDLRAYSVKMK